MTQKLYSLVMHKATWTGTRSISGRPKQEVIEMAIGAYEKYRENVNRVSGMAFLVVPDEYALGLCHNYCENKKHVVFQAGSA